jgi:AcrR family transcriptional regulator
MNPKSIPRPGGRSARVQSAVHQATQALIDEVGRTDVTVPMIAARAGVTPSTIYRRWGDLPELLADVAIGKLHANLGPRDTGSVPGDLRAWAEQYRDEMTSEVGLAMMRDVVAGSKRDEISCQCSALVAGQIQVIVDRGVARGEAVPGVESVLDDIVAPIVYRALFGSAPPTRHQVEALVEKNMRGWVPLA